jgi:hypothetical protein
MCPNKSIKINEKINAKYDDDDDDDDDDLLNNTRSFNLNMVKQINNVR